MKSFLFLLISIVLIPSSIIAQTHDEMESQVPELKDFHTVIFKLWHDAWPNKNLKLMQELVPGIDSHLVKLQKVELPGILRDKKTKWVDGVKSLSEVVSEYKKAVATTDTQRIMDAAENLHSGYEKLVRTIRPVLKEVDEFHKVLYPLYHYYMPKYEKDKIKTSVIELSARMDSLLKYELPERMISKQKAFQSKRAQLAKSVKFLVKVVNEIDDETTVVEAIKKMHTDYQGLEGIFN
ncbi:MAG: hypothetical protein HZB59_12920 [Ignavibacteriales bacterium]|nr:hypothetical protein [Ignavibacteriales bacterium]